MGVSGWLRRGLAAAIFLVVLSTQGGTAINNLRVVHQWKLLDYAWPNESTRQLFPHYIRENHNPLGIEVGGDKLFITIPRWRTGVVATLNYINLNGEQIVWNPQGTPKIAIVSDRISDTSESPLLNPYPSWEAHKYGPARVPELISVYRIRADRCGRLWVLDTGRADLLGRKEQQAPPSLTVYDLSNDQVLRRYVIPTVGRGETTFFTNVAVEDASCEDTFAYLADSHTPALVVYSWRRDISWTIKHHYFYPDPLGGNFNVSGLSFQWWDALIGIALAPRPGGYSTMYFHPLSSTTEFSVDTQLLRDPEKASSPSNFHEFKVLGSRGHNGQSAASFLDPKTGILFHAVSIGNYIACWKPGTEYNVENLGRVYADNVTLIMPSDIKVDPQGNIWVVSDRLPIFMYGKLDPDDYNFRVFTGSVQEAVRGTVCSDEPLNNSVQPTSGTTL